MLALRMTKKVRSDQIKDTIAYVDPSDYQVMRLDYHYTDGGTITMTQTFRQQGPVRRRRNPARGDQPSRSRGRRRDLRDLSDQRGRQRLGLYKEEVMLHEFQPRSPEETRSRILAATREIFR